MQVHPRVKIILWRFYRDILPTKLSLARNHVVPKTSCEICEGREEDQKHIFLGCGWVNVVWEKGGLNQVVYLLELGLKDWFKKMKRILGNNVVGLCAYGFVVFSGLEANGYSIIIS